MSEIASDRDSKGRFTTGNPGGLGRPRRPIERDYLRLLNEAVLLETWRRIIDTAVANAREGDDKARAWLSKYLLGDHLPGLAKLMALELEEIDDVAREQRHIRELDLLYR